MPKPPVIAAIVSLTLFSAAASAQTAGAPPVPDSRAIDAHVQRALEQARERLEQQMARLERQAEAAQRRQADRARQAGDIRTERFSRKVKLDRNGSVSIGNVSGRIAVTGGDGDEISIEAVKETRGDAAELAQVEIEVAQYGGRVDVRTKFLREGDRRTNREVRVNYTVAVPAWAIVEAHSVSGDVSISGVNGTVRLGSVSGDITATSVPRLSSARTVSGDIDVGGATETDDLTLATVSGDIHVRNLKTRSLDVNTVSGDISLSDASCDRLVAKSVNGDMDYAGSLAAGGRYDVSSHSGDVRLALSAAPGFELNASTFSGSIRSGFPVAVGGDRGAGAGRARDRMMRAVIGDGSAALTISTFSGDIAIVRR